IILTTHYIEEAEEMADRIGVINQGRIILVEDKTALMTKLGRKHLNIVLQSPLDAVPSVLGDFALTLTDDGHQLVYAFDTQSEETGISDLLQALGRAGLEYRDLNTQESSLEEIFVNLVHAENGQTALSQDATQ
ncbi:MAG: multidrug ABC transporter ATP-binding protein, partial [Natronospirillum sp.]